jgi:hypothetical protein
VFLRDMVCLRNISVDTLHKEDTDDDDDDDDNNNNNNNNNSAVLTYKSPSLPAQRPLTELASYNHKTIHAINKHNMSTKIWTYMT